MKTTKIKIIAIVLLVLCICVLVLPFPQKIHKTMTGVYYNSETGKSVPGTLELNGYVYHYLIRTNGYKGTLSIVLENGKEYNSGKAKGRVKKEGFHPAELALQGDYTRITAAESTDGWISKSKWISPGFNQGLFQYIIKEDFSEILLIPTEDEWFIAPAETEEEAKAILEKLYEANPEYPGEYIN